MLTINGVKVKTPRAFTWDREDYDSENTERNTDGEMMRDRITTKRKLGLEWGPLTQSECSAILNATSAVFFSVTYPDAMAGTSQTRTFYAGSASAPVLIVRNGAPLWEGLKMNLIEK